MADFSFFKSSMILFWVTIRSLRRDNNVEILFSSCKEVVNIGKEEYSCELIHGCPERADIIETHLQYLWVCNWENTKYGLCSVIFALIKKPA